MTLGTFGVATVETHQATPELRYLMRHERLHLQQKWSIFEFENGHLKAQEFEWRDVPEIQE